jgi:hypothetical protein
MLLSKSLLRRDEILLSLLQISVGEDGGWLEVFLQEFTEVFSWKSLEDHARSSDGDVLFRESNPLNGPRLSSDLHFGVSREIIPKIRVIHDLGPKPPYICGRHRNGSPTVQTHHVNFPRVIPPLICWTYECPDRYD